MTWLETVTACVVAQAFCGSVIGLAIWFAQLRARARKPALPTAPLTAPAANPLERAETSAMDGALAQLKSMADQPEKLREFFGVVNKMMGNAPTVMTGNAVVMAAPGEDPRSAVAAGEVAALFTRRGAIGLVNLLHEAAAEIELERPQLAVRLRRVRDYLQRGAAQGSIEAQRGPATGPEGVPHVN